MRRARSCPCAARAEEIGIGEIEISGSGAGDEVVHLLDDVLGAALPPATRGPVRRSAAEEGVDVAERASSVAAAASEDVHLRKAEGRLSTEGKGKCIEVFIRFRLCLQ